MTTKWIYRVDLTGLDNFGSATVFRYASRGYQTSPTHPTLANTYFEGRASQPLQLERDLYGQAQTHGDVQVAHGTVLLENSDGALDALTGYGFDAQKIEIWRIDPAAPDTENLVFRGQMESLQADAKQITVQVRDATYGFAVALQPTKYGGTNSLPNGLDGTPSDIMGQPKPICWGVNFNLEPVFVNTSRLIYQFHDSACGSGFALAVYDKRTPLNAGILRVIADFNAGASSATASSIDTTLDQITTSAAHGFTTADPVHVDATTTLPGGVLNTRYYYARVISTTVISLHPTATDATNNTNKVDITSAGSGTITVAKNRTPYTCYDWCSDNAGSYVRLGSTSVGRVTMDVTNPAPGLTSSWSDILTALVNRFGAYSVDQRVSATYSTVGVYWQSEMTVFDAVRELLQSVNASYQLYPNQVGGPTYLTTQRLEVPGTSLVLDLDATNIAPDSLTIIQPQDPEQGIPPWRVTCNYKFNHTVMTATDLAGGAVSDLAFTSQQYRAVQSDNSSVKSQFPAAPELVVDTFLTTQADASAHASYERQLYFPMRHMYSLRISMDLIDALVTNSPPTPNIPGLMLCMIVRITYPRWGLNSGSYFSVIGYTMDCQARTVDLIVWG